MSADWELWLCTACQAPEEQPVLALRAALHDALQASSMDNGTPLLLLLTAFGMELLMVS